MDRWTSPAQLIDNAASSYWIKVNSSLVSSRSPLNYFAFVTSDPRLQNRRYKKWPETTPLNVKGDLAVCRSRNTCLSQTAGWAKFSSLLSSPCCSSDLVLLCIQSCFLLVCTFLIVIVPVFSAVLEVNWFVPHVYFLFFFFLFYFLSRILF